MWRSSSSGRPVPLARRGDVVAELLAQGELVDREEGEHAVGLSLADLLGGTPIPSSSARQLVGWLGLVAHRGPGASARS